jgi:hypothetical protein
MLFPPHHSKYDTQNMSEPKGPITKFPAEGLRHARRFITSHSRDGEGIFVGDDDGDHHRIMVDGLAVANIIYSTAENPVDLNDDKDLSYARDHEVCTYATEFRAGWLLINVVLTGLLLKLSPQFTFQMAALCA